MEGKSSTQNVHFTFIFQLHDCTRFRFEFFYYQIIAISPENANEIVRIC